MNKVISLSALLSIALSGCSYGSAYEAALACEKWRLGQIPKYEGTEYWVQCREEEKSRQILGRLKNMDTEEIRILKHYRY